MVVITSKRIPLLLHWLPLKTTLLKWDSPVLFDMFAFRYFASSNFLFLVSCYWGMPHTCVWFLCISPHLCLVAQCCSLAMQIGFDREIIESCCQQDALYIKLIVFQIMSKRESVITYLHVLEIKKHSIFFCDGLLLLLITP